MYISEVMTTRNNETGNVTYYIRICDVWRRVSQADYEKRAYEDAVESFNFLTKIQGKYTRAYKTVRVLGPGE